MKRRHSSIEPGTITGIAEATAERVRLGGEILKELPFALARNEKVQHRFRLSVLSMLAKIQATVTAIHGLQLVLARKGSLALSRRWRRMRRVPRSSSPGWQTKSGWQW